MLLAFPDGQLIVEESHRDQVKLQLSKSGCHVLLLEELPRSNVFFLGWLDFLALGFGFGQGAIGASRGFRGVDLRHFYEIAFSLWPRNI